MFVDCQPFEACSNFEIYESNKMRACSDHCKIMYDQQKHLEVSNKKKHVVKVNLVCEKNTARA